MEKIVSLCKRRGFIFQSSEIYGGLQGFWDYGPLGVELKRNVREAWWRDMITLHDDLAVPPGAPEEFQMVGLETSIIMHPQVWKASGHFDLFNDMKVDCHKCHGRFRSDHLTVHVGYSESGMPLAAFTSLEGTEDCAWTKGKFGDERRRMQENAARFNQQAPHGVEGAFDYRHRSMTEYLRELRDAGFDTIPESLAPVCPKVHCRGALTEPREFNLMLESHTGAVKDEASHVFLRPETAQGMFVNFKNVLDSTRLKLPFGIAQVGKSFRNEITPRNFTFRSREFEQMEMEFFCPPHDSRAWYEYWRNRRMAWYAALGITGENLRLREHTPDELSHYSVGTADVEYAFPFLEQGEYGELEGIAHRGDFDLRSHMEGKLVKDENGCLVVEKGPDGQPKYRGSGADLAYFDADAFERDKERLGVKSFKEYAEGRKGEPNPGAPYRFVPHVIEPAAGADRTTLAFLCEAYHEDEQPDEKGKLQSRTVMRFHPRLAPIKAAVFPLIKKEGMPEKAAEIYRALKAAGIVCYYDQQGAIGRRYRRQDEIGTPWCITVDGDTLTDGTVTLRDRDTLEQKRIAAEDVANVLGERLR
ncbi:MAG: glycine--tRNA ligase [Planctomycetes bacterium]|nr:glycine--tRNA ligase [Planctomycetota bacterium]